MMFNKLNVFYKRVVQMGCLLSSPLFGGDTYIPKYVWNLGFAQKCDITPFPNGLPAEYPNGDRPYLNPKYYIKNVKDGDVIWLHLARFKEFVKYVFPKIQSRFILVLNDGDESFPFMLHSGARDQSFRGKDWMSYKESLWKFLSDKRVIHIFSQNVDGMLPHKKISCLPIGLDFHTVAHKKGGFGESYSNVQRQEEILDEIISDLQPTDQRIKRALIEFHFTDWKLFNGETRISVADKVMKSGVVDKVQHRMGRHDLWKKKGEYAFSISPHGNGLDCHRTWEDLVLGCIVIVKTSSLDSMYEGLPVVIVKDWSEINDENMDKWLIQYGDAFTNPQYRERLTHKYWMNKILSYKNR